MTPRSVARQRGKSAIMANLDFWLYTVHGAFWATFGATRIILRWRSRKVPAESAPSSQQEHTAPYSRALVAFHGIAFFAMYLGIGNAVIPGRVPFWFRGQRFVGTIVIAGCAALMAWALVYFQSWRFRAKLDEHHQLATGGPFRTVRHPIYMGLNMLALGSAIWVPTAILWFACLLMAIGSDLRARAEETLLETAFGQPYRDYRTRTRRFVPGIY